MSDLLNVKDKPKANAPIPAPQEEKKRYKIILEESEEISGRQAIIVNGKEYWIAPGYEVEVPKEVLDALDNAIIALPIVDPATKRYIGAKERRRFPYTMVRD